MNLTSAHRAILKAYVEGLKSGRSGSEHEGRLNLNIDFIADFLSFYVKPRLDGYAEFRAALVRNDHATIQAFEEKAYARFKELENEVVEYIISKLSTTA